MTALEEITAVKLEEIWKSVGRMDENEARIFVRGLPPETKEAYDEYVLQKVIDLINMALEERRDY